MGKYICAALPSAKKVAFLGQADPALEVVIPKTLNAIFGGCGKHATYTFFPLTVVDMAPVVTKVLAGKPDFIMTIVGGEQMVTLAKALQQNGYPGSKISLNTAALDKANILDPAGPALNGSIATDEVAGWGVTSNPDVAAYQQATQGVANPQSANIATGYVDIMAIYTAARQIGFANFDNATLANFMRTATGVHLPMSGTLLNPGPAGAPGVKQPYVQLVRWMNGQMTVLTQGTTDGWVNGF
jgi:ABC-type branched-subunit amino acid transport system substrate-binding protein